MPDDLVEMARLAQHDERMATGALYGDLADRIEKLEADRKKTYEALLKVTRIHEEVEAKLAKAVEHFITVNRMAEGSGFISDHPICDGCCGIYHLTNSTIAELKGGIGNE